MSRGTRLTLAALLLTLCFTPLGIQRPGLPLLPRGEEPSYLLAISSLAADGDLVCTRADLARLYRVFPFAGEVPVELLARGGDALPVYAVPILYPLLATPFAAVFDDRGPLVLNALLLALSLVLAVAHLRRANDDASALFLAAGFVVAGLALPYVFLIQPDLLVMTLVFTALWAVFPGAGRGPAIPSAAKDGTAGAPAAADAPATAIAPASAPARVALSGAALGLAGHLLAPLTLLAVPLLAPLLRRRRWAAAALWLLAAGAAWGILAGASLYLTGSARPATAAERYTTRVADPLAVPTSSTTAAGSGTSAVAGAAPATDPGATPAAVSRVMGYLLAGRHVGLLPYFPFVAVALVYFLWHRRRDGERWLLLASTLGVVLLFAIELAALPFAPPDDRPDALSILLATPGNRLLLTIAPAFLFLIGRITPRWPAVVGWALTGIMIGPLLFTPFGAPVAHSTAQAHVSGRPFALWPLELAWLARLPDYAAYDVVDGTLYRRRDATFAQDERLGVLGGVATTLWLTSARPLSNVNLTVTSPVPANEVRVTLAGDEARLVLDAEAPARERLRLEPGPPTRRLTIDDDPLLFYRLRVTTGAGAQPRWRGMGRRGDYLGAELAWLGGDDLLGRDLYRVVWEACGAPERVRAGGVFRVLVRLRNASDHTWPASGVARVRLGARWRPAGGDPLPGTRTDLVRPVGPEETLVQWQRVTAPDRTGDLVLELEPLFESVAWFGDRQDDAVCRVTVEVVPAESG